MAYALSSADPVAGSSRRSRVSRRVLPAASGSARRRVPPFGGPWSGRDAACGAPGARRCAVPKIRVASINGEWMNNWFTPGDGPAGFLAKFQMPGGGALNDTAKAAGKLAAEILAVDPDVLALEEAPSRKAELDLFVQTYLSTPAGPRYATILGDSGGAQKLAVLYKPQVVGAALAPGSQIATLLDPWEADVDGTMHLGPYQFTRVPLVVNVVVQGHALQLIVLHTKSSFVNNGEALWNDPMRRQDYVVAALKARRRNATEGMRVRRFLDERLEDEPHARIIVT